MEVPYSDQIQHTGSYNSKFSMMLHKTSYIFNIKVKHINIFYFIMQQYNASPYIYKRIKL